MIYLVVYNRPGNKKKFKKHMLRDFFIAQLLLVILTVVLAVNNAFVPAGDTLIGFLFSVFFGFFFVPFQIFKKITGKLFGVVEQEDEPVRNKSYKQQQMLPAEEVERAKIVFKFNERYQLCLTDDNVRTIVNSSYHSNLWQKEITAMREEYHSIVEWIQSGNSCLRIYLRVFNVMEISSDSQFQQSICIRSFDEVFSYMSKQQYQTVPECIRGINDHFLTNFDDVTFMMAYRILQSQGRQYTLPSGSTLVVDSELDEMQKKYDRMPMH